MPRPERIDLLRDIRRNWKRLGYDLNGRDRAALRQEIRDTKRGSSDAAKALEEAVGQAQGAISGLEGAREGPVPVDTAQVLRQLEAAEPDFGPTPDWGERPVKEDPWVSSYVPPVRGDDDRDEGGGTGGEGSSGFWLPTLDLADGSNMSVDIAEGSLVAPWDDRTTDTTPDIVHNKKEFENFYRNMLKWIL